MYKVAFICATLFASALSQCTLTTLNLQPQNGGKCNGPTDSANCYTACYRNFDGNRYGSMSTYSCTYGYYGYACQCTYTSTAYPNGCPSGQTDSTPCINRMTDTWCASIVSARMCSGTYAVTCYKACNAVACATTG